MAVVPANTVAAAFEVKSSLDKTGLEDAYEKIAAVKRLRKGPMTSVDRYATESEASTTGTLGVIFAYSSKISLDTLASHVENLNREYPSTLWPELVVVLDQGVLAYAVQNPGHEGMAGSFIGRPPEGLEKTSAPPWYIHLVAHPDGDLTLNRFWVLLHTHLTFYPYRSGPPPHDVMLQGAPREAHTVRGYWFDSKTELQEVPEAMFMENNPGPMAVIELMSEAGEVVGEIQYLEWADGGVLRASLPFPLAVVLKGLVDDPRVLALRPDDKGVQMSTLLTTTVDEFRKWPKRIEAQSNLGARLRE